MNDSNIKYLRECAERYDNDLRENIMPFWLHNGLDTKYGGIYTCLNRNGRLMDTTKSVWFQGRFAYVCSAAYNHVCHNEEWLTAAKSALDFIEAHCIDTDGHMFFSVTADGKPVQKRRYVFSECFAAMAFAEYSKATGDKQYADKALQTFRNIERMLSTDGFLPPKTQQPSRGHSITMMLINVAMVLKQVCNATELEERIDKSIDEIGRYFMHPEYAALLETVGTDGELIDTCAGRTINPGHCIETSWFILSVARLRGWDEKLVRMATTILDWSWKWGWDEKFGGIINFRDCKNYPPQDYSQDMKFWWPQCEAIIATLYAYVATGDAKYLEMHRAANDWAFEHLPDKHFGEWYGYLHRDGSVAQPAKGNLFKGPFHIPRMMIIAGGLCNEILKNKKQAI